MGDLTPNDLFPGGVPTTAGGTDIWNAMVRFAPEVRLHPKEKYFPMHLAKFLYNSQLRRRDSGVMDVPDHVIKEKLAPDDEALTAYGTWGDQPGHDVKNSYYISLPKDWDDTLRLGVRPVSGTDDFPATLTRAFKAKEGGYWFDYVFFYPYNGEQVILFDIEELNLKHFGTDWVERVVAVDPIATHIGDWEHVQVHIGDDLSRITRMRFFTHGDPTIVVNDPSDPQGKDLRFNGTHPIVYSALHSHATYYTKGHQKAGDLPVEKPATIHFQLDDWCADGGASWNTWEYLVAFGVDDSGKAIPGFQQDFPNFYPHRWGKSRNFHSDTPLTFTAMGKHNLDGATETAIKGILRIAMTGEYAISYLSGSKRKITDGLAVSAPDWWTIGY